MYRCQVCHTVVGPRKPRLVYILYRVKPYTGPNPNRETRTEITREIPVCPDCQFALEFGGVSLGELERKHYRPSETLTTTGGSATMEAPQHKPLLGGGTGESIQKKSTTKGVSLADLLKNRRPQAPR